MANSPLPAAFAHLIDEPNLAADVALVDVLPRLEPFHQAAAIEILIRRGHGLSLARVVGGFHSYKEPLRGLILARASDLSAGVRLAMTSETLHERAGAIEVIVESDTGRLAYLLADGLRVRCPRTRELAAIGLRQMTLRWLTRMEKQPAADQIAALDNQASYLSEAIITAIKRWEIHEQRGVLEAARWLGDRVEPALREKLGDPHGKITRVLSEDLTHTFDPRSAGFVLRTLAIPELRSEAARAISRNRDDAFLRAVLEQSWLLADERIEAGCRNIQAGPWQHQAVNLLLDLDEDTIAGAVRFLCATATLPQRKRELLGKLIGSPRTEVRRALLWQLVQDPSETATELLGIMASRRGDSVANMALREVRRRRPGTHMEPATTRTNDPASREAMIHKAFDRLWTSFDKRGATTAGRACGDADEHPIRDFAPLLRARLASSEPLDRSRALQMIMALGEAKAFENEIHRMVHDPDSIVRSVAVHALVAIPGPTTRRLLQSAVNDSNERVEANAVESLDTLGLTDGGRLVRSKLDSPHGRVRANAIKALLRAGVSGAAQALSDMLEDSSTANRLSALWVAERTQPEQLFDRFAVMQNNDPDERVRLRARHVCGTIERGRASARQVTSAPGAGNPPAGAIGS